MHKRLFHTFRVMLVTVIILPIYSTAFAKPPPWAPAHGYRNKYQDYYDYPPILPWHGNDYVNEFIRGGRCDRDRLGAALGGMIGGIAGSQIGKGSNRTAATITGTVIGVIIGRSVGQHMDNNDQQCTGQVLENAPDHASVSWNDPDMGTSYLVTPVNTYQHQDGRYCREYTARVLIGGRIEQVYGHACRQRDGSWVTR